MKNHAGWYKLDGKTPVSCTTDEINDILWNVDTRRVALTDEIINGDRCYFSTVFLVLDHNFASTGPPVLFETLCPEGDIHRYCTWDEAEAGHKRLVEEWIKTHAE